MPEMGKIKNKKGKFPHYMKADGIVDNCYMPILSVIFTVKCDFHQYID